MPQPRNFLEALFTGLSGAAGNAAQMLPQMEQRRRENQQQKEMLRQKMMNDMFSRSMNQMTFNENRRQFDESHSVNKSREERLSQPQPLSLGDRESAWLGSLPADRQNEYFGIQAGFLPRAGTVSSGPQPDFVGDLFTDYDKAAGSATRNTQAFYNTPGNYEINAAVTAANPTGTPTRVPKYGVQSPFSAPTLGQLFNIRTAGMPRQQTDSLAELMGQLTGDPSGVEGYNYSKIPQGWRGSPASQGQQRATQGPPPNDGSLSDEEYRDYLRMLGY